MARLRNHPDHEASLRRQAIQGFWPWFLQRASGVALIGLLGVHIWINHFADIDRVVAGQQDELVLFSLVGARLKTATFIAIDFSLLGLALYHGLNGVRNILMDMGLAGPRAKLVNGSLWALGLAAFVYGGVALLAFTFR